MRRSAIAEAMKIQALLSSSPLGFKLFRVPPGHGYGGAQPTAGRGCGHGVSNRAPENAPVGIAAAPRGGVTSAPAR
jgi:hypothetical protein